MMDWQIQMDSGIIPLEVRKEIPYFLLAYSFGWTIQEIDDTDPEHIERLIILLGQINKMEQVNGGIDNSRTVGSKSPYSFR